MQIKIEGVPGYDGEYELDLVTPFTMREFHTIKSLSGVRGGELQDAISSGDTDLMVAFAVIAVQRAGKTIHPDLIWDSKSGSITVVPDPVPEDPEDDPTAPTPTGGEPSVGTDEITPPSGATSNGTSDSSQESIPLDTGDPGSATTAT